MAEGKVSYRAKNDTVCPICGYEFKREELLTGGGRMNAGELTDELHRVYLSTQKFGDVYPLIYPVSVCPHCWYAAYPRHFEELTAEEHSQIQDSIGKRKNMIKSLFKNLDFDKDRGLEEGISSYVLAAQCYEYRVPETNPTFYSGLSFIRGGWLAKDLHDLMPAENYDYMSRIFLRKASFYYGEVLEKDRNRTESIEDVPNHGPDIDNNFGYDGVLYLLGVLLLKYGQSDDSSRRISSLKEARSAVARIVGMGKSSKSKPSALLDLGRELHKKIKKELEDITGGA
ncbi:MAG: DUF2225 domain-containing protein [Spirochaetes bacterium]|nr:MAG: DUF2225 domain-containing protein [Spirochaetota bacterium]RKX98656.1 MAG: DUF2225 domain-containing protein [Spirochaetota bacterium]